MRFPLEACVVFWWWDESGTYRKTSGRSRNVSVRGAYVMADTCPPVGAAVGLTISMPSSVGLARASRVEMAGRVLRVDQRLTEMGDCGFAVSGDEVYLVHSGTDRENAIGRESGSQSSD
jgi:hypothetical protein